MRCKVPKGGAEGEVTHESLGWRGGRLLAAKKIKGVSGRTINLHENARVNTGAGGGWASHPELLLQRAERLLRVSSHPKLLALTAGEDVGVTVCRESQMLADVQEHVVPHALYELLEAEQALKPAHFVFCEV